MTIAALVEGHTEDHFVRMVFPKVHVQRPFPNGKSVPLRLIAETIVDALEVIGGKNPTIIVLLDREAREETAEDLIIELRKELLALGCTRRLYIGMSDRHLENWIVADEKTMRDRFGELEYEYQGDGTYGKPTLEKLAGYSMGPVDKAKLLRTCSATRSSRVSESLQALLRDIDFPWEWAQS